MVTCAAAFLISLLVALAVTPGVRDFAISRNWLDTRSSSRKLHEKPVPRLGGVGIVVAFYAPLAGLLLVKSDVGGHFLANPRHAIGIFIGGVSIAIVGLLDDLRGMGAAKKFSAQFLISATMYTLGFAINRISTPWGALDLGPLSLIVTMLWITGVTNAINLIDGLDGLASGVAFLAVATNFVIAAIAGNILMMLFMASLGGAILGFLVYNFNPASIFMGDTGSMFLGFTIACTSVITNTKSSASVAMLVPILALGLPIMDTFLAIARRASRGLPLFAADKEHVHHKLLAMGLSQRKAVVVLYLVCGLFAAVALGLSYANAQQTAILLLVAGAISSIFARKLGYFAALQVPAEERERNLAAMTNIRNVSHALAHASEPIEVWQAIAPLTESLQVGSMSLHLSRAAASGEREQNKYEWQREIHRKSSIELTVPLTAGHGCSAELRLTWFDRKLLSREDEIVVEKLRDSLFATMQRLSQRGTTN